MTTPVIVGAGLAGLTVALELSPSPCIVLTTGRLGTFAATAWAQGGIAAAVHPEDSPALHAMDTMAAGAGMCDLSAVEAITSAAPEAVRWLEDIGARFDHNPDGSLRTGLEGAHSRNRIIHAGGDGSGAEIHRAVVAAALATPSIRIREHTRAVRILADGETGCVTGVVIEGPDGAAVLPTDAVAVATGGIGGLFAKTTNPSGARGQGLALAARAGARLRDLEMIQFHPTALDVGLDPMPLVSEAVRGEGAILVTSGGRRVIEDPLEARDVVSRAVYAAQQRGEQVYLDARAALGHSFSSHFPAIDSACFAAGIDPAVDLIPISPAAHYHMGGVAVTLDGRSSVPGLWAVGEVASTGLHGANRLASNSLLEAVVCGRLAAASLASREPRTPGVAASNALPYRISATDLERLRGQMTSAVGVLRDGDRLAELVDQLQRRTTEIGWHTVEDETLVAMLVARAALARGESVGGHFRTDSLISAQ